MLAGSAARGTWLAGDHDLDIFLALPEGSDLGLGLEVARLVSPHHEERYAEHAYVHARIDDFDVDLVPCYLLQDATALKSAVDRTPFHTRYVASKINGLEEEVLLLKQFMKGTEVYGSELKTGGFSGAAGRCPDSEAVTSASRSACSRKPNRKAQRLICFPSSLIPQSSLIACAALSSVFSAASRATRRTAKGVSEPSVGNAQSRT